MKRTSEFPKFDIDNHFTLEKDLDFAKIYYNQDLNIVKVNYSSYCAIDGEKANEIIKYSKSIADTTNYLYALSVMGKKTVVTPEGRSVFGKDDFNQNQIKSTAIVINELAQRVIFSLYLKINKPKSEIIAFKSESLAFMWLSKKAQNTNS